MIKKVLFAGERTRGSLIIFAPTRSSHHFFAGVGTGGFGFVNNSKDAADRSHPRRRPELEPRGLFDGRRHQHWGSLLRLRQCARVVRVPPRSAYCIVFVRSVLVQ